MRLRAPAERQKRTLSARDARLEALNRPAFTVQHLDHVESRLRGSVGTEHPRRGLVGA